MLTREMSDRVKNSLTSVVAMLHIQSRSTHSDDVRCALEERRITCRGHRPGP
ncbi:histidine kinase dimerization/phosphoacceptor domain -containing protein [Bradyrhizobium sp.]|jgi:two-component sensor histidine kinase|uniref:histidine kinase dimerization/phosphoacceptor domain -containing protein n=1 Tax=Bradyrhizobium TaxID=374 RepID=UPI00005E0FBE